MSSRALTKIDQKEYLKKYLSGDKEKKKKKKDKKQKKSEKVKIIDDDINHLDSGLQIDEELLLTGDDAPQIVGEYIQEVTSESNIPKWKSFGVKEEPRNERISDIAEDLWGRKNDDRNILRRQSPDSSPPRRKDKTRHLSSSTPPRRQLHSPLSPRRLKNRRRPNKSSDCSSDRETQVKDQLDRSITRKSEKRSPDRSSTSHRERFKSLDLSPSRRIDSKSSPYRSPHRQSKYLTHQSELRRRDSPKRKKDSDHSPLRKRKIVSNKERKRFSNQSPPRKGKKQSPAQSPSWRRGDSMLSTPLGKDSISASIERKHMYPDQSPLQRRRDSDLSPPRKNINSPSRSRRKSPKIDRISPISRSRSSPLSRIKLEKTSSDILPPRHTNIKRESLSPPAPRTRKYSRWERQEAEKSPSPPPTHKHKATKTLEGKKAGLQDAQELHKESLERRKQEDILFEKLSSEISGRNAEIQVRSTGRQGRRAREAKEEDPEDRRRKEAHEEKKKQLYDRWGKGLKQIEDYKNRLAEQEHESNKPLARYSNDEDLERHLKEQERADDPMLEYMRQKRKDKEKLSGKPQVPIYQGSFPENRFAIRPGYRWDGVDRSNGYEKKYFDVQNEKRARQDEAYKYSVEDM